MNITIENRQKTLHVKSSALRILTEKILARALPNPDEWSSLSVILVNDRDMIEANRACFGKTTSTDVISIAYPPFPPITRSWKGELVLNTDRARHEGHARGGQARELAVYLAHGCNHLNGSEDTTPAERARMRRRENYWLRQPDIRPWIESCLEETRPHA